MSVVARNEEGMVRGRCGTPRGRLVSWSCLGLFALLFSLTWPALARAAAGDANCDGAVDTEDFAALEAAIFNGSLC